MQLFIIIQPIILTYYLPPVVEGARHDEHVLSLCAIIVVGVGCFVQLYCLYYAIVLVLGVFACP